jgi:hypothetical protein
LHIAEQMKQFFLVFILSVSLFACAQSKTVIKKSWSFYTERTPGNIIREQNDQETPVKIDTIITVYIESSVKNIVWDMAWKDDKAYLVVTQLISPTPVDAGVTRMGNEKIIIKPAKGNYLWQLYLQPLNQLKKPPQSLQRGQILLRGKYKGKSILRKIETPVALESIPSV